MQATLPPTVNGANWQPLYHFYKPGHWINDPNGLIFIDGIYHLYYQMNPDDVVWGNMHWGHASTSDLVNWQHQSIAIAAEPQGLGYAFSGSAVLDKQNTAGLAISEQIPVVAIYTQHSVDNIQRQSLAYSHDGGHHFRPYPDNPVIDNPGLSDFRDPKIVWHTPDNKWVMVLSAGQAIHFYSSVDLRNWQLLSVFEQNELWPNGTWECPDLFPLVCQRTGETKWILLVSINPAGQGKGSAMQYFTGFFDGKEFINQQEAPVWFDYGPDCYAGMTWDNTPDNMLQRMCIGWMNNWDYANDIPTQTWRGAMTIPRIIKYDKQVLIKPAKHIEGYFGKPQTRQLTNGKTTLPGVYKLDVCLRYPVAAENWQLCWQFGSDDYVHLEFDPCATALKVTRQFSSLPKSFNRAFTIPLPDDKDNKTIFSVYADRCSLEFFFSHGKRTATVLIFPCEVEAILKFDAAAPVNVVLKCSIPNG